jgi:hypothetical protein
LTLDTFTRLMRFSTMSKWPATQCAMTPEKTRPVQMA